MTSPALSRRHPRVRERPVIGMLFGFEMSGTGLTYNFIDALARGIHAGTEDRHCDLLLACGANVVDQETLRPAWPVTDAADSDFVPVGPWNTDGLIVVHPLWSAQRTEYIQNLKASGFPVVFVGTAEGGPAVDLDNAGGVHQALQHLRQHGHRHIAYIGGFPDDINGDGEDRLRAFKHLTREQGLVIDSRLIAYGYHHATGGRQAMQKILATGARFTAVLASNDESALGAIQALSETGLRVPQDVAVVGFDNRPEGAYELPSLTTIHHPVFERGYRAVGLLLDYLEGRRTDPDTVIRMPTRLVVRRSCGCTLEDVMPTGEIPATSSEPMALSKRLTRIAMDSVLTETLGLNPSEVYELSRQLAEALVASLERNSAVEFLGTLRAILARVERTGSDAHAWNFAIDALQEAPELSALLNVDQRASLMVDMLLQHARVAVAWSKQRQHWRKHHPVDEVRGFMTAHLMAARDEVHLLEILAEHLPKMGIQRAALVLFESEGANAEAWSVMRTTMAPDAAPVRFRSQEFPPSEFSGGDEQFIRLTLVPIGVPAYVAGYLILETGNLGPCRGIAYAVNAALKNIRAREEAAEREHLYNCAVEQSTQPQRGAHKPASRELTILETGGNSRN